MVEEIDKKNEEELSDENLKNEVDFDNLFINANFEKGKKIVKQCAGCHDLEKSKKIKVGPPLWSIVGKQSASSENFEYSESLKNFKKRSGQLKIFITFLRIQKLHFWNKNDI